ncbi:hypothetical protein D3C84_1133100 [compost metagenome]
MHVEADADRVAAGVFVAPQLDGGVAVEADVVGHRQVHIDAREDLVPGRVEVDPNDVVVLGDLVGTPVPVLALEQLLVVGHLQPPAIAEFNQQ